MEDGDRDLQALFETVSAGMVQVEPESGRFLRVNRRFCEIVGYTEAELIGRRFADITHPEDRDDNLDDLRRLAANELAPHRFEKRYVRPDGQIVWVLVSASMVRDRDRRPLHTIAIVIDITEHRRAEEVARANERRARAILDSLAEAVVVLDAQGEIESINPALTQMFGFTIDAISSDIEGQRARILGPDRRPLPLDQQPSVIALHTGQSTRNAELGVRDAAGDLRWVSVNAQPIRDLDGAVVGAVASFFDITEQRRAAQVLRDEARRKDEFLALLSHELRNPLSAIRTSAQVLGLAPAGSEAVPRAREVIERQIAHLVRIVDDLLDIARIARGKLQLHREHVDLAALVRETAEDQAMAFEVRGVGLEIDVPGEPLVALVDRVRIAQVISNLLANAMKFTPRGGRVVVEIEGTDGMAVLRVTDTGVGIDPDELPGLFEPFVQATQNLARSGGGLGLGLALVKRLAELHGGRVGVSSDGPGQGARFWVRLPLDDADARTPEAARVEKRVARRVLVIEDNVDAADSLREALTLFGHDVRVAYDGPAGLRLARELRPDVVLCDLGLPGMNGYEVARAFRADPELQHITLAAITGYALPEDQARAREAGFTSHLAKPVDLHELDRMLVEAKGA